MSRITQVAALHARELFFAFVVSAALGLALVAGGESASAHTDPVNPSHHDLNQTGQTLSCLPNGSCTHGPDPAPEGLDPTASQSLAFISSAADMKAVCDGNGTSGKRVQVLYIYRTGTADNFATFADSIKVWSVQFDQIYQMSAEKTGGMRYVRYVHDASCTISVLKVRVDSGLDYGSYYTLNTELAAKGYNRSDRIYLGFLDHQGSQSVCGWGNFRGDDSPGSDNESNRGSDSNYSHLAVTYRGCWDYAMVGAHELGHTFGAVQASAPHGTIGAHCKDEWDVMCYADGQGVVMTYACGDEESWEDYELYNNQLDCNNDDYFNTNPAPGSYLATHWNVARSDFLGKSISRMQFDKASSKYNGVITVSLSGFKPNYFINLKWPDGTLLAQVKAGGDGTATTTFRTPLVPLGDYLVRASNSQGESATTSLRVIPRILLNETQGETGDSIRVYFYGFVPGEKVEVRFYNASESSYTVLTTITIANTGRGSKVVTIPTDTTIGNHKIMGKVLNVSRSASTTFKVTGLGPSDDTTETATPSPTETGTPEPTPSVDLTPTIEIPTEIPTIEVPTEEPTVEVPTEEPTVEIPTEEPTFEVPTEEPSPTETPVPEPTESAVVVLTGRRLL